MCERFLFSYWAKLTGQIIWVEDLSDIQGGVLKLSKCVRFWLRNENRGHRFVNLSVESKLVRHDTSAMVTLHIWVPSDLSAASFS